MNQENKNFIDLSLIKDLTKKHLSIYKLVPSDEEIEKIIAEILEEQKKETCTHSTVNRTIRNFLVINNRNQCVLDNLKRSPNSASIWRKLVPEYLERAEMSYIKGDSLAGIFFCRLAIEMALRDKMLVKEVLKNRLSLEEAKKILANNTLGQLLDKSKDHKIFDDATIKLIFNSLILKEGSIRENILNKFIHGDFIWLGNFLKQEKDISWASDKKNQERIVADPDIIPSFLFIDVLKASYLLMTKLYS